MKFAYTIATGKDGKEHWVKLVAAVEAARGK